MTIVKAKKALGQHFLKDLDVARQIAQTLDAYKGMPILEVGPGMGVLTRFLMDFGHDLKVVEFDRESVKYLQEHFPSLSGRIISDDFLTLQLNELYEVPFCVIGNYPYNISSQIFFKVLEYKDKIPCCSGMIQKEVAERIASKPGKKAYGILSVLLQAYYDIEYLFTVNEDVFIPPPKVKSAVIRLTRNKTVSLNCDEKLFKRVIKTGFNQRRKTLRNSLKPLLGIGCPICIDPIFNLRPEQLSVEQFVNLTNMVSPYIGEDCLAFASSGKTKEVAQRQNVEEFL